MDPHIHVVVSLSLVFSLKTCSNIKLNPIQISTPTHSYTDPGIHVAGQHTPVGSWVGGWVTPGPFGSICNDITPTWKHTQTVQSQEHSAEEHLNSSPTHRLQRVNMWSTPIFASLSATIIHFSRPSPPKHVFTSTADVLIPASRPTSSQRAAAGSLSSLPALTMTHTHTHTSCVSVSVCVAVQQNKVGVSALKNKPEKCD